MIIKVEHIPDWEYGIQGASSSAVSGSTHSVVI